VRCECLHCTDVLCNLKISHRLRVNSHIWLECTIIASCAWAGSGYLTLPGRKPRIQKLSITAGSNHHPREASWSKLSPSFPCLFQTIVSMNPLSSRWQQIGLMFWNYFWLLQPTRAVYVCIIPYIICVARLGGLHKRISAFYESSRHGLQKVHPSWSICE
jgi:hypothetical protein